MTTMKTATTKMRMAVAEAKATTSLQWRRLSDGGDGSGGNGRGGNSGKSGSDGGNGGGGES